MSLTLLFNACAFVQRIGQFRMSDDKGVKKTDDGDVFMILSEIIITAVTDVDQTEVAPMLCHSGRLGNCNIRFFVHDNVVYYQVDDGNDRLTKEQPAVSHAYRVRP